VSDLGIRLGGSETGNETSLGGSDLGIRLGDLRLGMRTSLGAESWSSIALQTIGP